MALLDDLRGVSSSLITQFGEPCTIITNTMSEYDVTTASTVVNSSETISTYAVRDSYKHFEIDGEQVQNTDFKAIIPHNINPEIDTTIQLGDGAYRAIRIEPVYLNGGKVISIVQCRR